VTSKLFAAALLAAAGIAGGCGAHTVKLGVDRGSYHVRGEYMGSQRQVKLFVESLRLDPIHEGRRGVTAQVTANVALLNERPDAARFRLGACSLDVGGQSPAIPLETQIVALQPGKITRATLTFRTLVPAEEFGSGSMEVVVGEDADAAKFTVPFGEVD
jgi:hypothetical protein